MIISPINIHRHGLAWDDNEILNWAIQLVLRGLPLPLHDPASGRVIGELQRFRAHAAFLVFHPDATNAERALAVRVAGTFGREAALEIAMPFVRQGSEGDN